MDVSLLLERIQHRHDYCGQLEHIELLPAREGIFAAPTAPLPDLLDQLLAKRGIKRLYAHQVSALEAARDSQDYVVVTGTASGKTLCYNLPILESLVTDAGARALYLFPTKALAQDQCRGLLELTSGCSQLSSIARPGVYDGDTPNAQRRRIRNESRLVLSNPDMLHAGILPYHPKWSTFFSELRYVVVDEVHMYRGILGAHVAAVMRRLQRICDHYGSRPIFSAASATIANPGELTGKLIGRPVKVIDNDGSPRGRKYFVFWNPQPHGQDTLARGSANDDAVTWLVEALQAEGQVLAFTRTRQAAELVFRFSRQRLEKVHSGLAELVRAYRGGYLPHERRQMEQDLFHGKLRGVAATNALELGIDIGSLDVALLVNYPGTIASCWQQAGRSGRRHEESLAVLLAGNDPVDQYLLRNPHYFFTQSPEHAVADPDNPYVLAMHLQAAAFELPLTASDMTRFGPFTEPIAAALGDDHQLTNVHGEYYFAGGHNPAVDISLRHMSDNTFTIVERCKGSAEKAGNHQVIASVDAISAPELVYPEAIYLHHGETYSVRELDLEGKVAYVERRESDYYTQAVLESNVLIKDQRSESRALPCATLAFGDVEVRWKTVAFKKIKFDTRENIGWGPVDIPAQNLESTAFWLSPNDDIRLQLKLAGLRASEGIVGLRNLAVVALPLVAMCDSRDLGGVVDSTNLGRSTLIIYDRYPGGLGYSEKGFQHVDKLLAICLEMVRDCSCYDGCPSCVGLPNLRPAIHSDPDLTRGHPLPNKDATVGLLVRLVGETAENITAEGSFATR